MRKELLISLLSMCVCFAGSWVFSEVAKDEVNIRGFACTNEVSESEVDIDLELQKSIFMQESKAFAQNEYNIAMEEESRRAVAELQQSEASTLRSMSANLENLAVKHSKEKAWEEQLTPTPPTPVVKEPEVKALLEGARVDEEYKGQVVSITGENRRDLEALVFSEAGNQGFEGAALVAQALRDTMVYEGVTSVRTIKSMYGYAGSLGRTPNEDVKRAVAYIFDEGGMAVQHRLFYFYAFRRSNSSFHESQKFIIQYKDHRFFDRWE